MMVNIASVTVDDPTTRTHQVLAAPRRAELLALLRGTGRALSVVEAAEAVGLHTNTARMHLEQLVQVGLAERVSEQRSSPGRPRTLYQAAPQRPRRDDSGYQALAGVLADGLAATADPLQAAMAAGERWARVLEDQPAVSSGSGPVAADLEHLLDELGFEPEMDLEHGEILLHRCPFAEVARENRTVVCGVHLGMLRASLRHLGMPEAQISLESFVTEDPLLCRVHLDPGQPSRAGRRAR